jgi:invasion protein IalB
MSFRVQLAAVAMTAFAGFSLSVASASAQSPEAFATQRHDLMENFGDWSKTLAASAKAGTACHRDYRGPAPK